MSKIKICGLRRETDMEYVNDLLPDYIGFILSPGFRRSISLKAAARLKEKLSDKITAVGVFVNESEEFINLFVNEGIIDMVQLHGNESPAFCQRINAPVIKYFKCGKNTAADIQKYNTPYYLFDSGTGSGKQFDWNDIPKTETPFFLAGGISAQNIEQAIKTISPFAVDISSSVETDGFKDYNKMKKIMEMARYE